MAAVAATRNCAASCVPQMQVWPANSKEKLKGMYFKLNETMKIALDEAGIEIPFPHTQLIVDTVEDRVWEGAKKLSVADS